MLAVTNQSGVRQEKLNTTSNKSTICLQSPFNTPFGSVSLTNLRFVSQSVRICYTESGVIVKLRFIIISPLGK